MELCNDLKNSFVSVLLPQNFHYRDESFANDKLNGVSAVLVLLNYSSNFFLILLFFNNKINLIIILF